MITRADLKQSSVVFDEAKHTYHRGDAQLSGITGLIKSVLFPNDEPDKYVKEKIFPIASYYGICVHKAIQAWDELGIELTQFPEKEHPTAGILPAQDVSAELAYYRKAKPRACKTIASEFTVDHGNFASQIDCIWGDEDGNIFLVDHKTNNLDSYPGGAAGLREYLSWQLSCYAVMFEKQTGYKVKGLLGNWLRKGAGELWRIERKPDEQVLRLLATDIVSDGHGRFAYINPEMQVPVVATAETVPATATTGSVVVPDDVISAIAALLRAEKAAKAMKERLRSIMEEHGIVKWECEQFTATIGKPSETTTFDSKAFQADHPDLYEQYLKTTTRKGSFTQKLK